MIDCISIIIITKNAAAKLRDCLDSVDQFAEVIIYDNGSTDETLNIAKKYANVKLHQGEFLGFGPTKNHAVSLASNDWVFSLDADEMISDQLLEQLKLWNPENNPYQVGQVLRKNLFMGKFVNYGGWGNDWLVRLFNRTQHAFNANQVHEKVALNSSTNVKRLKGHLAHYAVDELGQFLKKIDRYTEIRKKTSTKTYLPILIVLRSFFAFFRSYILKLGLLAGWRGLVIAVSNANGVFFKYMKIYAEKHRTEKKP